MDTKRVLLSLVVIGAVGTIAVGASRAFFSDTETSTGNTFAAGAIDLKIDNQSYYNGVANPGTSWTLNDLTVEKFFNFTDVKPSDWGEDTISVHVNTNDAWVCADVKLTSNDDNGITTPESLVDITDGVGNGELASAINFIWWADDGDNVLESDESIISSGKLSSLGVGNTATVPLADSQTSIWGSGPLTGGVTKYIGKAWCFGTLTPQPLLQDGAEHARTPANSTGGISCNGTSLGNETQSDSLTADVTFRAVQARNNPNFLCRGTSPTPTATPVPTATPTPTSTPTATPIACQTVWASSVQANNQGTRKDGSGVLATRTDATDMLGPANGPAEGTFFSLGVNGSVILKFTAPVHDVNGTGVDLSFHEITNGRLSYPLEKASVEVSADNITYYPVGDVTSEPPGDGIMFLDFSTTPLSAIQYVKLTDTTNFTPHASNADGYDVDAVDATCGTIQ